MADNDYLNPLNTKLDADQTIRRAYDETKNRHRVDAEVTASIGTVDVIIDASAGDNIAIADQTGTNFLDVEPDGSINVNVTGGTTTTKLVPAGETENYYATDNVAIGASTTVLTYTVGISGVYIQTVYLSGTVIAEYRIFKNSTPILVYRMSYTEFSAVLELSTTTAFGVKTNIGDVIEVEVTNVGNSVGTYDISLQNLLS